MNLMPKLSQAKENHYSVIIRNYIGDYVTMLYTILSLSPIPSYTLKFIQAENNIWLFRIFANYL